MNNQQAIEVLKDFDSQVSAKADGGYQSTVGKMACEVAISALEKQIPKKPITYKGTNRADCPTCGAVVRGIDKPFGDWCAKCGRAIDWGN